MGFFDNMNKKYDEFREDQLERKKKNNAYLKKKAAVLTEEAKYKGKINKTRANNLDGFNQRMGAFNGAIMGAPDNQKKKKPGEGVNRWF